MQSEEKPIRPDVNQQPLPVPQEPPSMEKSANPSSFHKPPQENMPVQTLQQTTAVSARPIKNQPSSPTQTSLKSQQFNRRALLVLIVLLAIGLFPIMRLFIVPVILSATLATLLFPLYKKLLKLFFHNAPLASFCSCLILLIGLLLPLYIITHLVTLQAIDFYTVAAPYVKSFIEKKDNSVYGQITKNRLYQKLKLGKLDWNQILADGAQSAGKIGTAIINRTSSGIAGILMNAFIMLFTLFYLLMDGERILKRLSYLSPLRRDYEEMLFSRFLMISRATIRGTILIGIIQGVAGGFTLYLFGIKTWLLWGFLMVLLSVIPMTGAWMVMLPTAIVQIATGHLYKGLGIAFISIVIISSIDNVLRPRVVGKDAKMHDLVVFFSTIGGIAVFGIMGFIAGPVIAALFNTILEIYGIEYKNELSESYTDSQGA
ncbi:MAG: AI-2E family transporter [Chitinivibrionales bacterium]|nr:AI-2E family transporter [Chitinivibrionales bacterium]